MSKFKCGDRVRIIYRGIFYNREAVVWQITKWKETDINGGKVGDVCYCVDIKGQGKYRDDHARLGFCDGDLEPLVPPDELAWQKFREHLRPNPLVIFDADPIIVSTDEEAARIAETVPNSHIKVVIRGVVVSEYYGRSQTNRP